MSAPINDGYKIIEEPVDDNTIGGLPLDMTIGVGLPIGWTTPSRDIDIQEEPLT